MKKLLHIFEAMVAHIALAIFGAMPFAVASNIGGFLGRHIGSKMPITKLARRNIKMAMPELPEERVEEIINGMWDNLGRVVTEYSHMNKMTLHMIDEVLEIEGQENLDSLIKAKNGILMTGHFGNWEMIAAGAYQKGCPLHIVYREANNPHIDKIICDIRKHYQKSASPKGSVGARQIIKSLQNGGRVAMLVDQKQNDGIEVPFFGRPAMTAPAIATLALKYDTPIYPARIVRVGGAKFRMVFYKPVQFQRSGNVKEDSLSLMKSINIILEGWVRENPGQWFWVHNRWPKEAHRS